MSNTASELAKLIQEVTARKEGWLPPGERDIDKAGKILGMVGDAGTYIQNYSKQALEMKAQEIKNRKEEEGRTPFRDILPSTQLTPANATINENTTPEQRTAMDDLYARREAMGTTTLDQAKTEAEIGALNARANATQDMLPVAGLPAEARARAVAAGFPEDGMINLKKFNAFKTTDPAAPVPTMTPQAGLKEGSVPGNTKILEPRGTGIENLSPGQASVAFKLRDDFRADSSDFVKKRNAYNNVISSGKMGTAGGDLAFIYAFTKLQDPTMVTEQEIQNAVNSGKFGDRVKAAMSRVLTGERLAPDVRNDFLNTAGAIYQEASNQQKDLVSQYQVSGEQLGIDPKLFIVNYEAMGSRKKQELGGDNTTGKSTIINLPDGSTAEVLE